MVAWVKAVSQYYLIESVCYGVQEGLGKRIQVNVYGKPAFDPRPDGYWNVVTRAAYAENPKPGSVPRTKDEGFRFGKGAGVILLDSDPRPDAVPPVPSTDRN